MTPLMQESARQGTAGRGWIGIAVWTTLLALVLVAGLNVTFAAAVMPNLAGADDHTFVTTLQRYNDNAVFPGSYTVALVLAAVAPMVLRRRDPAAVVRWAMVAFALYVVVFVLTMAVNVPLNNEIDAVRDLSDAAALADVRERFETTWVAANAVRTVLSFVAAGALVRALQLRTAR
ncbi:DUF1772 domain-containing protein [Jiangella ureilytica]|uniref:DUF1772 domain-containing protein n=1 Tax=Jiangella ureilytica TaxID=2530374 RepID=A0A4R4RWI2_9ACTN|nr:DUF1772 domain-containing protein [Jiangella ureilytica]TDC54551.1 DUF1772 domain-containing protein [Jiangella ureilytica]